MENLGFKTTRNVGKSEFYWDIEFMGYLEKIDMHFLAC